jgi:hypothetical protein
VDLVAEAEQLEAVVEGDEARGIAVEMRVDLVGVVYLVFRVANEPIGRHLGAKTIAGIALGQHGAMEQAPRLEHAPDLGDRGAHDVEIAVIEDVAMTAV